MLYTVCVYSYLHQLFIQVLTSSLILYISIQGDHTDEIWVLIW